MVVAGTTLAPIQSYAIRSGGLPDTSSLKHGIRDDVSVKLEHRDQHMNQENLCYRTNTCRQANDGQNTLGNDNSVTGFADQSDNIQQSAAAPTTPTGNQTTTPTGNQTTTPLTCEQCFTSLLNGTQISELVATFPARTLGEVCTGLENGVISESNLRLILLGIGVSSTITDELIACLKAAGIVFT